MIYFLAYEDIDGNVDYEEVEGTVEEVIEIAKEAKMEDDACVRVYNSFNDEKYGIQPATHIDEVYKI